jgi:hypothetical protein
MKKERDKDLKSMAKFGAVATTGGIALIATGHPELASSFMGVGTLSLAYPAFEKICDTLTCKFIKAEEKAKKAGI